MHRDKLIEQVKNEYTKLASDESQQHFSQTTNSVTSKAYYEKLLGMVIDEITAGTFDGFHSGREIMEAVAADKNKWLSQWGN